MPWQRAYLLNLACSSRFGYVMGMRTAGAGMCRQNQLATDSERHGSIAVQVSLPTQAGGTEPTSPEPPSGGGVRTACARPPRGFTARIVSLLSPPQPRTEHVRSVRSLPPLLPPSARGTLFRAEERSTPRRHRGSRLAAALA